MQPLSHSLSQPQVNTIISNLALPNKDIHVAVDCANTTLQNSEIQAYAKLAGKSWSYYVKATRINIGRSQEPNGRDDDVQLDLGPSKIVSRKHASIAYNGRYWEIDVFGRNGVKIDKVLVKQGRAQLFSGNILDVGGVQMMFILPDIPPKVSHLFMKLLQRPSPILDVDNDPFQNNSSQSTPQLPMAETFQQHQQLPHPATNHHIHQHTASTTSASQIPASHVYQQQQQQQLPPPQSFHSQQQQQQHQAYFPQNGAHQYSNYSHSYSYSSVPPSYTTQFSAVAPPIQQQQTRQQQPQQQQLPPVPLPKTSLSLSQQQHQQSSAFPRGIAMITQPTREAAPIEYNEQDLSRDEYKDTKPPFSYATMITQAILSTPEKSMSLADIYAWIKRHYSYFRHTSCGWQNSIRHNLSLSKSFEKLPRKAHEPGKGMKWYVTDFSRKEFEKKQSQGEHIKGMSQIQRKFMRKPNPTKIASPTSEMVPAQSAIQTPTVASKTQNQSASVKVHLAEEMEVAEVVANLATSPIKSPQEKQGPYSTPRKKPLDQFGIMKTTDTGILNLTTPSPSRYSPGQVTQLEAYTPDRGSNKNTLPSPSTSKLFGGPMKLPELETPHGKGSTLATPLNKTGLTSIVGISTSSGGSSTTSTDLGSSLLIGSSFSQTPAPLLPLSGMQLVAPNSAQQQQLPSSYMPNSSPAPFWKLMQFTSTPGSDFSPTKFSSSPAVEHHHLQQQSTPTVSKKSKSLIASASSASTATATITTVTTTNGNGTNSASAKENAIGDLKNVDLAKGFKKIPKFEGSPEKVK